MPASPTRRPPNTLPARRLREPHRGRVQRLVEAAERFGVVRALRGWHDRGRATLTILAYHRVMPTDALDSYPFDPELISATPQQFEWQMQHLRRQMQPVSLEQVVAHLDGQSTLPPAAVAVTFDDGFADSYRYAFPILKRHGIPTTLFLTTGYVDSGEPFWFELAAYLMLRVEPGAIEIEVDDVSRVFPSGDSYPERTRSRRELHELLKRVPNARRAELIRGWSERFTSLIKQGACGHSRPISWAQVREMAEAGIGFGSHSVTHPNLKQLDDAQLQWEMAESRRVIEQQLQRPIQHLAYPIGTAATFDQRVIRAAEQAGYRLGLTYLTGANPLTSLSRFELRRHGIGLGTTERYFRALTSLPAWLE